MTTTTITIDGYRPRHVDVLKRFGAMGIAHPVGECGGCDEYMGDDTYAPRHKNWAP